MCGPTILNLFCLNFAIYSSRIYAQSWTNWYGSTGTESTITAVASGVYINQICVRDGDVIDQISVYWNNAEYSGSYGSNSGTSDCYSTNNGECFTGVYVSAGDNIDTLQFTTSDASTGPWWGGTGGTPTTFDFAPNCLTRLGVRINLYIDGIRFYSESINLLTPNPTSQPTLIPTFFPTLPTPIPTQIPTTVPSNNPTNVPTANPSNNPTMSPSFTPSSNPTFNPTYNPTDNTLNPSMNPTLMPSKNPTLNPTVNPTYNPTNNPITENPTIYAAIETSIVTTKENEHVVQETTKVTKTSEADTELRSINNNENNVLFMTVGASIGGTLLICIVLIILFVLIKIKRRKASIHQTKQITNIISMQKIPSISNSKPVEMNINNITPKHENIETFSVLAVDAITTKGIDVTPIFHLNTINGEQHLNNNDIINTKPAIVTSGGDITNINNVNHQDKIDYYDSVNVDNHEYVDDDSNEDDDMFNEMYDNKEPVETIGGTAGQ